MLSDIKKKSTGWIGSFIIAVLALLVCLSGMQYYLTSSRKDAVVVTIDDHDITQGSLDRIYQVNKASFENGPNAAGLTQSELASLKHDLLEMLIDNQLKLNYAHKSGMQVPAVVRDMYVSSQEAFKEGDKFSVEKYAAIVSAVAGSEAAYLAQVDNELLAQQLVVGITSTAFVLPEEVKSIVDLVNQQRNIRYVKLSPDSVELEEIKKNEIESYYNSHKSDFIDEAKVKIDYVVIDNNNIAKNISLDTKNIKEFYASSSHLFPGYKNVTYDVYKLMPGMHVLSEAELTKLKALVANDKVAELDEYIANNSKLDVKYESATVKASDISDRDTQGRLSAMQPSDVAVYQSNNSLVLLQLKESEALDYDNLSAKEKKDITSSYIAKNTELKFAKLIEEVTDLAYTEDDLSAIAKASGSKINTSNYFTQAKGDSLLTNNESVRKMAFSEDLLVGKLNSSVINLDANKVVVFRVKEHVASRAKKLAEATPKIKEILKKKRIYEELNKEADGIIKNAVAKKNDGLDWISLNNIARTGIVNRFAMEIRDDVFQTPISSADKPSLKKVTLENGNVVVFQVLSSTSPLELKVKEADLKSDYKDYWARWNLYAFENNLRAQAEIKYSESKA